MSMLPSAAMVGSTDVSRLTNQSSCTGTPSALVPSR
jgi:hypothetical protein